MKYFRTLMITLALAALVAAAVWPAVGDAPWEKPQRTRLETSPTPKPTRSRQVVTIPRRAQSDADRLAAALRQTREVFDSLDAPDELKAALQPSMVAYYLAETPKERARAETDVMQTILLWRSANPKQGGTTYVVPSGGATDWRTDSDIRQLEYEIGRLRRCINYGVSCY